MKGTMKHLLLSLLMIATAGAAPTAYTDLDLFKNALPFPLETQAIGQTIVLFPGAAGVEYATGQPLFAAGLLLDTTPAGPGTGIDLSIRLANGTEQHVGFWGGDGSNVIGFRGVITTSPFQALILRTGWYGAGVKETVTIVTSFFDGPDNPGETATTPEPGSRALFGFGFLILACICIWSQLRAAANADKAKARFLPFLKRGRV